MQADNFKRGFATKFQLHSALRAIVLIRNKNEKLTLLVILFSLSGLSFSEERIIAVEGAGAVEATPDIILISYYVSKLDKKDPSRAKTVVDDISSDSVKALIKLGFSEIDITSSSLEMESVEDYDDNGNSSIIGHVVRRKIDIIVRDISLYGDVIQVLVDSHVS